MGCGVSRSQPGEEIPPGLRPFWRRMQEVKRLRLEELRRRRRERKDSNVSVGELLQQEERWGEECCAVKANTKEGESNLKSVETEKVETEEDARRIGFGREQAAEELPGSPSFRFYFSDVGKEPKGNAVDAVRGIQQGQEMA